MLNSTLICHPATPTHNNYTLTVSLIPLLDGSFNLHYQLIGDLQQLQIPPPQAPAAADNLWEHTCFEAFVGVTDETHYHEFNFSPSGQWAAYAFSATRTRSPWASAPPLKTTFTQQPDRLTLEAYIPATALPPNITGKPLQFGLTAVLETLEGHLTYLALQHPASHPDFHDRKGFIVTLPQA